MTTIEGNPYLRGNFAPVAEEVTVVDLEVDGAIPPVLDGRYVRSGPNPIDPTPDQHWFVGDGMVHGVRLRDGRAEWYRNRWVTTSVSAPVKGVLPVGGPLGDIEGSGNTNVVHHAGQILAINELSDPYLLSPELDTVARTDLGGLSSAGMTAHPKFDPATGEMHVMAYHFAPPYLRYHVVDGAGRVVRTEELAVGGPVMVHDMSLTESQVVAYDLPVVFDLEAAAAGVRLPYAWDPDYRARIGVMPRAGAAADTVWIDVDPCYVFHPLNAYDLDDHTLVIDLVRYDRIFADDRLGPGDTLGTLDRWTVDLAVGSVRTQRLDDRPQEFPRADERLATRPHRFGYVLGTELGRLGGDPAGNRVLKHDLRAGTTEVHELGAGRVGGEFVFVPAADDAGEDEGWLVGYVYDGARGASDLVILDAHDFGGAPVGTVHLPVRVPAGFHGNWIPDRALA